MDNTYSPVLSNVADVYEWKVRSTIVSNVVATGNKASAQIQILPDSFFCLMAFRGSTNYDQFSGDLRASVGAGPAAATRLGTPPRFPNNFEVFIKHGDTNLTGAPVPQSVICSNGYFAGVQFPWPVLYQPATMFYFDFYNVARTLLNNNAAAAIDLTIDFGLWGYNVPVENLPTFLAQWPAIRESMFRSQDMGLLPAQNLTTLQIPGLSSGS